MPLKVRLALEAIKNWRAIVIAGIALLIIPFMLISSVVNTIVTTFVADPQKSPDYKAAASAESGVDWKAVYVIDFIRYDGKLESASPSSTIRDEFVYYTEEQREVQESYIDDDGKEHIWVHTVTERVRHVRSFEEVINRLGFDADKQQLARDMFDNLIDDNDVYGGDDSAALPPNMRAMFQTLQTRFGVDWYILAGIWEGVNHNVQVPQDVWNKFQTDGNQDGNASPAEQEDQIYTLANYLQTTAYKTDLASVLKQLFPGSEQAIQAQINSFKVYSDIAGSNLAIWPTPDYHTITSPFGYRINPITHQEEGHKGIDFGAPSGAIIVAAFAGEVINTIPPESSGGYGNLTIIENKQTHVQYYYAHQSRFAVSPGMIVKAGDLIGYVGATGQATGPHLHFEIRINGRPVNPIPYLQKS